MSIDLLAAARWAIQDHRAALARRFGWTMIDVDALVYGPRVVLRGQVLIPRMRRPLREAVAAAVGTAVNDDGVEAAPGGPWHGLARSRVALWRSLPGPKRTAALVTELVTDDGPVQRMADHGGWSLVRASDGTLGWIIEPLGPQTDPPSITLRRDDPVGFVAAALRFVGRVYKLGGTTSAGIDCSGLVQRSARQALGAVVPRHSTDQLAIAASEGEGSAAPGDLCFTWSSEEAPCHVGVATGDGGVVHASRRRGVVREPVVRFFAKSARAMHVRYADIVALQRRLQGHALLTDVMELGSEP